MYEIIGLEDLRPEQIQNKRVFVRVDFNVPIQNGQVGDITRLRASLPSIQYLIKNKAIVILASHI
jgi:phosphoglycerate kinase